MTEMPQVGDSILVDGSTRTVSSIIRNTDNLQIICWVSTKGIGTCLPSTWEQWKKEKTDPYVEF